MQTSKPSLEFPPFIPPLYSSSPVGAVQPSVSTFHSSFPSLSDEENCSSNNCSSNNSDIYSLDHFLSAMQNGSRPLTDPTLLSRMSVPSSFVPPGMDEAPSPPPLMPEHDPGEILIDGAELHLYPIEAWTEGKIPARQIIELYFRRRSSKKMPFHLKLYNALTITSYFPSLVPLFGIQWVSFNAFKIYRIQFAQCLGLNNINGALFNKQGSLPTHGFVQIPSFCVPGADPSLLSDVDGDAVRLFQHSSMFFHVGSTEQELSLCRWRDPREN